MTEPAAHTPGSVISILICDDAPALRFLLAVAIALREGMAVIGEAADGHAAIAQAERLQPDVILLDLSMPNLTGLEALPEINRVAPAAKVIVFSGFAASIFGDKVFEHEVVGYLEKGIDPEAILTAIEKAAAGERLSRSRA